MTSNDRMKRQAGATIVAGFDGPTLPQQLAARLRAGEAAGVILFKRNVASPEQVKDLCASIQACATGAPFFIGIDQEGGRVQRIREPLTLWPPMRELGLRDDVDHSRQVGAGIGRELAALGVNLNFAPVLDVVSSDENTVIGDRSFGADPELVARHALAIWRGLRDVGVVGCGKHFPGHGGPVADSHHQLPTESRGIAELKRVDLVPFSHAIAAGIPLMMIAHVIFTALDDAVPATFSERVISGVLRDQMRYSGVVSSDDMEMGAITEHGDVAEACVRAVSAGIDLLLICHREDRQRATLEALVERAESDSLFAAKLGDSAHRVNTLRGELPSTRS